ncbi:hypothetical protein ScalyP_jg8705 [Parmales sp. scaly parma]|nr:hypothetical protein ScalyP_jg8705 [Parmales sp. scaly parma]
MPEPVIPLTTEADSISPSPSKPELIKEGSDITMGSDGSDSDCNNDTVNDSNFNNDNNNSPKITTSTTIPDTTTTNNNNEPEPPTTTTTTIENPTLSKQSSAGSISEDGPVVTSCSAGLASSASLEAEKGVGETYARERRNSLLKKSSSFVTPSGEHIEPKKIGRRLSFSDESGAKLCETAFSDKLHYSTGHSFIQTTQLGTGGGKSQGCCTVS